MKFAWFLAAAAACGGAHAKCGGADYRFTGSVVTAQGAPIPNAHVIVSWYEKGMETGPLHVALADHGAFAATVHFDTYSHTMLDGRDVCDERLQQVRICASADGYATQCRQVATPAPDPVRFVLAAAQSTDSAAGH